MARNVSLTTLIQRVRRRADIENATARFPDAELTQNINDAAQSFADMVRSAWGHDYFRSAYTFTTTANQANYALPADFLSLISVDVALGGAYVMTARPYMESERNRYKWFPLAAWGGSQPIFYRLNGSNISFIPTPSGGYSITINYANVIPDLVGGSDVIDGIAGWEEYITCDAAATCLLKDQDYEAVNALNMRKSEIRDRIRTMATERDQGAADRVQDVVSDMYAEEW